MTLEPCPDSRPASHILHEWGRSPFQGKLAMLEAKPILIPSTQKRLPTLHAALGTSLLLLFVLGCSSTASGPESPAAAVVPETPETYEDWVVEATPERLERGRYLAHSVANCIVCHSQRSWDKYAGPVDQETLGAGSKLDYISLETPAPNITPAALSGWSDAEMVQLLTQGIDPGGEEVHTYLPGGAFQAMAREDVYSVVAYLRTLEPIPAPASPGGDGSRPVADPEAHEPALPPDPADEVATGGYLVQLASCRYCHGESFMGGKEYRISGRDPIETKNISNPAANGADRQTFTGRFTAFASDGARRLRSPEPHPSSIMPWTNLGRMTEEDLGAMYEYLYANRPQESDDTEAAEADF